VPDPETWLSRAGSQCVRCWERWLSPVRRRVAAHVRSIRHARVRCLDVLCCHPLLRCHSTLRWHFYVCQQLCFKVHTHTQKKHMRGQRMRQKIASRASSVFASSSRQGAAVERACALAYIQAKFGCSESANEQSSRAQDGSEPGRRGASRAMTADQVHAAAVVGECANSGQRGRFAYTCGPPGVPQEYARCEGTERSKGAHQCSARR